ncbi:DNA polymerase IV [Geobacter hydrogenophilus]|uniref:DNA polymerase IV n=1 Tax=Geobacter hydrogenophilus TaxID=40983 RepID=A0A9W6G1T5_9BACT|nr:DNA polymerase IV [Geobacter hydrogenophilus]MBT0893295.1 DNA polymerase IV [Geobacter hydrogenophilus]GLI38857.1 DNA polymerase IV [Geobacter hydrogenophilus]
MESVHERTILHVDQNAFFASVEQEANPELREKPIAVIGRGRTVVTTASYEARAFGVKTGMTTWEARRACPSIILVVGNNAAYTRISVQIKKIFLDYTPLVETFSIDEAFLDVTGSLRLFGSPERIAHLIKARIRHGFGLTCSIGIASNKLLAKLASEMQKPDGLTVIRPEETARVLETVPIEALCGIGRKTQRQLALLGIRTCGDLGRFPVEILRRRFGVIGERLVMMGQGRDDSPVVPDEEAEEVKSVGHSTTLDRDISGRHDILRYLLQLSEMVGRRARRYGVAGKTVHLTVRYADFTTFGRQQTLPLSTNDSREIYREAVRILDTLVLEQPVRLLGVRITNLCHQREQLPLFHHERCRMLATGAMDAVNDRYGDFSVTFGSLLDNEEKGSFVISPAWRPEGIRNVDVK